MLGKMLGGRYELIEKIGGGGMAIVYKARCHLLKRYVAVKILRPEFVENEEFIARFQRESQAAASLSHPNIVNMYDVGQENDIYYIVMEYIDGMTLKEYIHERGKLYWEEAVGICIQICSALDHAHKNNIIHRDIKPQNILLNKEGTPKVADFGIARAVTSSTVTMAGTNVIGSVHYFSPEQAKGEYVGKQSDIYSLGIVLYEMVTGVVPFEGDTAISIALKHVQESFKPPVELNPDIPKSVQDIIYKAMEKEQAKRYQSATDMLLDLKKALKDPDGDFVYQYDIEDQATRKFAAVKIGEVDNSNHQDFLEQRSEEDIVDESPLPQKKKWLLVGASFVIIFSLMLILFFIVRGIVKQNFFKKETEVPLIEGYDEDAARTMLKSKGLILEIIEWRNDDDTPEGQIISQSPESGMTVKVDSSVQAVVSSGIDKVIVPNVVNDSLREAEIALENLELTVGELEYAYSNIPSGYVSEQKISPYTEVPKGTEIMLVVSKGPDPSSKAIKVGEYIGLTEEVASQMIETSNLSVGEIHKEANSKYKKGIVFKQEPNPDTYVETGRKINLWVSLGNDDEVIVKKQIKVTLDGGGNQVNIKIIRGTDSEIIYDSLHNASEGIVTVDVEGTGLVNYYVFIDDKLVKNVTVNFAKRESEGI